MRTRKESSEVKGLDYGGISGLLVELGCLYTVNNAIEQCLSKKKTRYFQKCNTVVPNSSKRKSGEKEDFLSEITR
ncbi:hypothetical protein JTE90_007202 [Oedothorax gibbosus]|uniref:Uncharacterized protein n=1 Tax=Oedothorax gibbosus TaxID=931172 RepID=A0AAV6UC90_9ARAC|nr:hypothetical protein JTE90_007202 [Oedothorax gibbosus]